MTGLPNRPPVVLAVDPGVQVEPARVLIGPPHAHRDAPCDDTCYGPAPVPVPASTEPSQDRVDYVNDLMEASRIPDSWDDDASADDILKRYFLELERRVLALGGSLEAWPEEDDDGNALRCPTCTSREPRLHPAAGDGGEVTHLCPDAFHTAA